MNTSKFKDAYASVLKAFVESLEELHLAGAAELGREMVQAGVPPEEIAEIHETAIHRLAEEFPDKTLLESAQRISAPLMEMLMAYGLAFRERQDERDRVMAELECYRDNLKEMVRERTEELRTLVNAMAGRENRMAGLKGAIKKLRTQLEDAGMTPVADDPLNEG